MGDFKEQLEYKLHIIYFFPEDLMSHWAGFIDEWLWNYTEPYAKKNPMFGLMLFSPPWNS